jgi:hypothetical protein
MPFGSSFAAMHQVAFADDANQLALIVYDRRGADPPLQKDLILATSFTEEEEGFTVITGETVTSRALIQVNCRRWARKDSSSKG